MSKTDQQDLLQGSLSAHIIRLSLPMIVAMLFQTGFSVIDMIFVGMVSPAAMAVLSIVFPVIFFFVSFAMGVQGAAVALVISRVIWVILCIKHFASGKSQVRPVFRNFRFDPPLLKEILMVSLPSTITFLSSSIGLMVFMKLVSGYGSLAIAAFGIGGRIENIAILPALGMSGAVLTIAGQNYDRRSFAQSGDTLRELES